MEGGYKDDLEKVDLSLLSDMSRALLEVAQVMHFGTWKYERGNWLKGLSTARLRAAQKRHESKENLGEVGDSESGLLHLAHRAATVLMELELKLREGALGEENIDELHKCRFIKPKNSMPDLRTPEQKQALKELTQEAQDMGLYGYSRYCLPRPKTHKESF